MKNILIVIFLVLGASSSLRAGQALGISYDAVWVARLDYPNGMKGKYSAVDKKFEPTDFVKDARKVRKVFHDEIDRLFPLEGDYNNGMSDALLQMYSLVFYKSGKIVLAITPNLVGGNLYATDKGEEERDVRSLSREQRDKFMELIYMVLATSVRDKEIALPKNIN